MTLSSRQRRREPGRRRARGQFAGGFRRARVLEAGPGGSDSARLGLPFGTAGSSAGAAGSSRRVRFLVERLVCRPPSTWAQLPPSYSLGPRGMAAPSMKERQACWGARDEYWKCLDEKAEDASQCEQLRSAFESRCPQQWGARSRAAYKQVIVGSGLRGDPGSDFQNVTFRNPLFELLLLGWKSRLLLCVRCLRASRQR
ncbi:uncharacterized protein LOC111160528 isoform X2 [Enhydra lutris kenyoni]|uniref:Uncharacterized protein LOC111160528 isoform X2 n=1 Tax=Enhydra lutris kenyoni TaxID=391180 RepID=A0A2Y9L213_ENHLU|nr:uncharacterized protein LOC111160528 isoform X2 [Enhydra lutris kenyoni]